MSVGVCFEFGGWLGFSLDRGFFSGIMRFIGGTFVIGFYCGYLWLFGFKFGCLGF